MQQLSAQREAQGEQDQRALQEQQRQAYLEAQTWIAADAERQRREQEAERRAMEAKAAEEQHKKEESARERARVSAKMRSSLRPSASVPSTPKPTKKVAFADENALPPAFSVPSQSSNAPINQPLASSSSGPSTFNAGFAAQSFLAGMATAFGSVDIEDPDQFPDAPDEGEDTDVDDLAQAKTVQQAQGELDEPEGFAEMIDNIEKARRKKAERKKAADFF